MKKIMTMFLFLLTFGSACSSNENYIVEFRLLTSNQFNIVMVGHQIEIQAYVRYPKSEEYHIRNDLFDFDSAPDNVATLENYTITGISKGSYLLRAVPKYQGNLLPQMISIFCTDAY